MKKSNKLLMTSLLMALTMSGCTPSGTSSTNNQSSPAGTSTGGTPNSSVVSPGTQTSTSSSSSVTASDTINTITWTGVEDKTVSHKKILGVKTGVTVRASSDQIAEFTIPAMFIEVTAEGATIANDKVDTSTLNVGATFTLTYRVSDDLGDYAFAPTAEREKTITVTVTEEETNLVTNGDFEDGTTGWATEGVPASGTLTIEEDGTNHYAKLDVTGDSGNSYQPRINTDQNHAGYGLRFEKGKNYQLSYKAKADNERNILVQIGRLLSAEPWFYLYKNTTQAITTEWATYTMTFEFTGNADANAVDPNLETDGHVVFECGKVDGVYTAGAVYFDDVVVSEFTGEIPDEEAPVIEGTGYLRVDRGATLDLMAGVTATDNRDGDLTSSITYSIVTFDDRTPVNSIDTSVDGKYRVNYSVSDAAGNTATATRTVRVCEASAPDENAFTAPTAYKNGGEGDATANPGTLYEWHDQAWCGSTVTVNEFKWEDGALTLDYTSVGSCWFGMQLFYCCPDMATGSYQVTLNVNSSVAGKITIGGTVVDLVVGDNTVTYTISSALSFSAQFGESATSTMVAGGRFVFSNFTAYPA